MKAVLRIFGSEYNFKFKTKSFKIFHIFWAARYNLWRFLKKQFDKTITLV